MILGNLKKKKKPQNLNSFSFKIKTVKSLEK